ncbi:FG-GAP repeat domain-containing protein [Gemmatimonadota bacterium]
MDLNGDGMKDILSGSDTGSIFIFYRRFDGSFKDREPVTDASGNPIRMVVGGAVASAVDWDRDSDLDLLVGDSEGYVHFYANESNGRALMLQPAQKLTVGRSMIISRGMAAAPHVVDWDDDGSHDLLVGNYDGAVRFYRNTSSTGMPRLSRPIELVSRQQRDFGRYSKVCTGDWNNDGHLDLIMGTLIGLEDKSDQHGYVWVFLRSDSSK